jgi:hypothetical protein
MDKNLEQLTEEVHSLRVKQVKCRAYVEAAEKALEVIKKCLEEINAQLVDLGDGAVYSDIYFRKNFPRGLLTEEDYDRMIAMIAAIPAYYALIGIWDDPLNALSDWKDQIHILQDMKAARIRQTTHLGSLFKHVSNIPNIFRERSVPLPKWYQDRYCFWAVD